MNEKIKELALQTVTRFDKDMDGSMEPEELGQWVRAEELEKFAELIVRECCQALNPMLRDMISRGQGVDLIKKHFGVEE